MRAHTGDGGTVGSWKPDRTVRWWVAWSLATMLAAPLTISVWLLGTFFLAGCVARIAGVAQHPSVISAECGYTVIGEVPISLLVAGVAIAVLAALPLGTAQWLALRARVAHAVRWLGATMLGSAVAAGVAALLALTGRSPGPDVPLADSAALLTGISAFFLVGCGFAVPQWFVLRRWLPGASLWIMASGVAWGLIPISTTALALVGGTDGAVPSLGWVAIGLVHGPLLGSVLVGLAKLPDIWAAEVSSSPLPERPSL